MRKILLCGALMLLTIGNAASAGAAYGEKDWAVDVLRPHGHARSQAVKQADGATCNNLAMSKARYNQAAFDRIFYQCVSDHGWKIVRTEPAPSRRSSPSYETGIDPITQSAIDAGNAAVNEQANEEASAAGAAAAAASAGQ
jgi:hypothetical protein